MFGSVSREAMRFLYFCFYFYFLILKIIKDFFWNLLVIWSGIYSIGGMCIEIWQWWGQWWGWMIMMTYLELFVLIFMGLRWWCVIVTWQALAVDHDDGVGAMVMVLWQVCQRQLAFSGARSFCDFFFFFLLNNIRFLFYLKEREKKKKRKKGR